MWWWPRAYCLRQETNTNRFVGRSFFQPFSCSSYVASSSTLQFICKNFSPMCMGRSSLVRTFFEFGRLKTRSFELTRRGGLSGKLPFLGGYLAFFGHLGPNLAFFAPSEGQKAHVCLAELFASLSVSEFDFSQFVHSGVRWQEPFLNLEGQKFVGSNFLQFFGQNWSNWSNWVVSCLSSCTVCCVIVCVGGAAVA